MPLFKAFVKEQMNGERLQPNGKVIRKATIKNYKTLLKNLINYELKTETKLRIRDYDYLNTRTRQIEARYWEKFYLNFTDYLFTEVNAYDNYVGMNMKLLRAFFNYIDKHKFIATGGYHNNFYRLEEEVPIIVLSPERLNFLILNKEFDDKLPKHLKIKKDMFVFGCTTALRFSDLTTLNRQNLEYIGKRIYLCKRSVKTGITMRILLPDYCLNILHKYKRRKKSLFPPISNNNFNIGLRNIARLAGWTEVVGKTRSKRGVAITQYSCENNMQEYRFCDLLSSHIMRRTAITTLLQLGLNEINVRHISGHKPNSPSFFRYVNYSSSFFDDIMNTYYEKLNSLKY